MARHPRRRRQPARRRRLRSRHRQRPREPRGPPAAVPRLVALLGRHGQGDLALPLLRCRRAPSLYVGITSRRTGRSLQHAGEKAWWGEVARATWEHFGTREQAADAERRAIRDEQPAYNVVGRTTLRLRGDDGYHAEAVRRWPDGMDMAWDGPLGAGRWATVAWCGGMSVMLWHDPDKAEDALLRIDDDACGHACDHIGDHELVDLALHRVDRALGRVAGRRHRPLRHPHVWTS